MPVFALIMANREQFKKIIGERQLTVNLMNMIYAGEIAPMVQNSPPDWEAIALKIKPYGAPGRKRSI